MPDKKDNEGSYMYYKDYQHDQNMEEGDVIQAVKQNHKTEVALLSKIAARLRGRGGRFRGKSGTQENNKARGGKMAR
jgi:hypothetical protein